MSAKRIYKDRGYIETEYHQIITDAMVFGAHLLPFGWLYDSRVYIVIAIAETVLALILGSIGGSVLVAGGMVVGEVILSVVLIRQKRLGSFTIDEDDKE